MESTQIKLLPKQEGAIFYLKDKTTTELIYGGAAGGGKSAVGCLWLMEMCQTYKGSRWLMGRSKLSSLKETTLKTFFELASQLGISNQFKYNAMSNVVHWHNGSEIILKDLFSYPSDPNYDSLGSLEITGAFIDECNQVVYKAWQIVNSRIRYRLSYWDIYGELTSTMKVVDTNWKGVAIKWVNSKGEETTGLTPKILGTCNPSKNWVYKEFYKPSSNDTIKSYRKFMQALPSDNPHLHPSYLESLLRLDKNSRERLYYGNWEYDNDPATLIEMDAITDYFNPIHLEKTGRKYMTIDVARKGKDKTVFRVWHGWVCIYRDSILKSPLTTVVTRAKELQAKFNIPLTSVVADEDGVGGGVVDFLGCEGFVNNSRPLNDENYDNLKSQCSVKMANKIQLREVGEICTDTDVKDSTGEEMGQVKIKDIDKDGKVGIIPKNVITQIIGRSPDDWDTIMMRYYFDLVPFKGQYFIS